MSNVINFYKIVNAEKMSELEKKVDNEVREGWLPHGSMVIRTESGMSWFYQPMTHS